MDGAHFDVPGQGFWRGVTRRSGWAPPGPAGSPSSPIAPRGEGREPAVRAFAAASAVGGGGVARGSAVATARSEEHTSELQSRGQLVCRLLLEKKKKNKVL